MNDLAGYYSGGAVLIGYEEENPVACIAIRKVSDITCEGKRLFIKPDYRGKGYARIMLKAMTDKASEMGFKEVVFTTKPDVMSVGYGLYKRMGFEELSKESGIVSMRIDLSSPIKQYGFYGRGKRMKVFVVYCHPSSSSFTCSVKEEFIRGLKDAGHSYEISDLYGDGFNPVMSEEEYLREGFYRIDDPIAEDVRKEQQKINEADIIVFIYPDFWTAAPAMLEGWFQRVWTYGFAYGDNRGMKTLDKAIFLITMGGSLNEEIRRSQLEAMRTVMIGDRIRDRARQCEVYVFDEMTRGYGNTGNRENRIKVFLRKAYDLGKEVKTAEEGDDGDNYEESWN